jgi:hypothetical protein
MVACTFNRVTTKQAVHSQFCRLSVSFIWSRRLWRAASVFMIFSSIVQSATAIPTEKMERITKPTIAPAGKEPSLWFSSGLCAWLLAVSGAGSHSSCCSSACSSRCSSSACSSATPRVRRSSNNVSTFRKHTSPSVIRVLALPSTSCASRSNNSAALIWFASSGERPQILFQRQRRCPPIVGMIICIHRVLLNPVFTIVDSLPYIDLTEGDCQDRSNITTKCQNRLHLGVRAWRNDVMGFMMNDDPSRGNG